MADTKSIAQSVEQAECDIYVPIAEAQSLLELYGKAGSDAEIQGWACLSRGVMERLVDAFEVYRQLLREQGYPVCEPYPVAAKSAN